MRERLRRFFSNPPIEWTCGKSKRHVRVLDALENATEWTVSLFRDGKLDWTRDVREVLTEFACGCAERVLEHDEEMTLPVYDSVGEAIRFKLSPALAEGIQWRRRSESGEVSVDDGRALLERMAQDTMLPSGFCLSMNAGFTATNCVRTVMTDDSPQIAYQAAKLAAAYMGCRAACRAVDCSTHPHETTDLVWQSVQVDNEMVTHGAGCPQVGNRAVEAKASKALNAETERWWDRFNNQLANLLEPTLSDDDES